MITRLESYLQRCRDRWGDKFDASGLAHSFAGHYNTGDRIEVQFEYGEVKRGTVAATTGWRPSFMLMLTKRSSGSIWLLSDRDKVLKVVRCA
jgi:hypothetical protein